MAAFVDWYNEVKGSVPELNVFLAKRFVNRAWKDLRQARFWSFNRATGTLWSPDAITTGLFSVTQNSLTAFANAAAITALTALSSPLITLRQIRFAGGPIYNIAGFIVGTGELTLDRLYGEATNTAITYDVYRCYYGPPEDGTGTPTTDFLRYISIVDAVTPLTVSVNFTSEEFDQWDPQRTSMTNPAYLGFVKGGATAAGLPIYELYPGPMVARAYFCTYMKQGVDFSADTDTLPAAIPDDVLISRALWYAASWAMMNTGKFPALRGINWQAVRVEYDATYQRELNLAKKQDQETFVANTIVADPGSYRNSAAWQQSHAVPAGGGGF